MERHTLSDGTWVDIRDPEEVSQRGRRGINAIAMGLADVLNRPGVTADTSVQSLGLTEDQADAIFRMQEATVVAFLAGWSRPDPVPTLATIGDLPGGTFDELAELTAKRGASLVLDTSPSLEVDPARPSGSSAPSGGPSKAGSGLIVPSTLVLPNGGVPTATAS